MYCISLRHILPWDFNKIKKVLDRLNIISKYLTFSYKHAAGNGKISYQCPTFMNVKNKVLLEIFFEFIG